MRIIAITAVCAALFIPDAASAQRGPVAAQCAMDINQHCAGLRHRGGAVRRCLEDHFSDLSQTCRAALEMTGGGRGQAAMSVPEIVSKLEGEGYSGVRKIEREGGHYELKAVDANGYPVEIYVDAFTGEVLRIERE